MATSQDRNLMLSVRNFGPIYSAEVELRPLTVFVGPSNTGKSYLAILIYALHKFFNGSKTQRPPEFYDRKKLFGEHEMSEEDIARLYEKAEQIFSQMEMDRLTEHFPLPDEIASLIRPLLSDVFTSDVLANEMMRCFGIDGPRRFIRHGSKESAEIALSPVSTQAQYNYSSLYKFTIRKDTFTLSIPDTIPLQVGRNAFSEWYHLRQNLSDGALTDKEKKRYLMEVLIYELFDNISSSFANPMSLPAYYLPADRTGIMHARNVVMGSLIQGASRAGLHPTRALPVLSGVVADFLEQLIELDDLARTRERPKWNLPQRLENEILRGEIHIKNSATGYPVFSYQPTGWKEDVPLMNTSSMVSELAPVVLYLRHVVSPGEVLIIEEPESHLHPGMQVAFIRHLAAAVRSGIRVIITTHSEWVLEELANLVRLSELSESDRKGIGGAGFALRPDQVGAWLFEPKKRPKGSIVKEIPLDVDYGGFRSDYDDIAIGTHNDWATIGNRIIEREHE